MPQLDPFTFSSQVFWLIIVFLIGYFLFFNFIIPNVYSTLKARNSHFLRLHAQLTSYSLKKGSIEKEYRIKLNNLLTSNLNLIEKIGAHHNEFNSSLFTTLSSHADLKEVESNNLDLLNYFNAVSSTISKENKN